ncbi:hypothetical protein [Leifsonia sp. Le1]|uniref:hypothetical protein n=1 Tax=Leifsonia sp. Le1 TaxID=3404918 RepID=UPI003EBECBF9
MPRITSPQAKATFVVLGWTASGVAALFGALALSVTGGVILYCATLGAVIVFGARVFRGEEEDAVAPRPLWRMTAKPTAGFLLAGFFAFQAVSAGVNAATADAYAPLYVVAIAFSLAVAGAYLNSSLRLRRG